MPVPDELIIITVAVTVAILIVIPTLCLLADVRAASRSCRHYSWQSMPRDVYVFLMTRLNHRITAFAFLLENVHPCYYPRINEEDHFSRDLGVSIASDCLVKVIDVAGIILFRDSALVIAAVICIPKLFGTPGVLKREDGEK